MQNNCYKVIKVRKVQEIFYKSQLKRKTRLSTGLKKRDFLFLCIICYEMINY